VSRAQWLGRPVGKHAAGARGRRSRGAADEAVPALGAPEPGTPALGTPLLRAPVAADAAAAQFVSPVTDAARAAVAVSAAALPGFVPLDARPVATIDALGRKCPIPIIMLAERIGEIPVGAVVALLADDPAAFTDIPAWCGLKSHDCVFRAEHLSGWSFGIRRRY
jgi:tRNA 2-thiouridine synthesizing protein A